jgi:hypothetical protein
MSQGTSASVFAMRSEKELVVRACRSGSPRRRAHPESREESAHGISPSGARWAVGVRAARDFRISARYFPIWCQMGSGCARGGWTMRFAHSICPPPAIWDVGVREHGRPQGRRNVFRHLPPNGLWVCAGWMADGVRARYLPSSRHLGSGCARRLADAARAQYFPIWCQMGSGCARGGWTMRFAHSICPPPAIWAPGVRGAAGR